jgi:hypothetical protein
MTHDFVHPMRGVPCVESPFFEKILPTLGLSEGERRIALDLHRDGFAVLDFPDEDFDEKAAKIIGALDSEYNWQAWRSHREPLRVMDAWRSNDEVREIAVNARVLQLLSRLYGRNSIPFQTLNFPVGTEQHYHSDSVHFSSFPERFMCGVWVALEDIDEDNGPLLYYPGSHRLPIYTHEHTGSFAPRCQEHYEEMWEALVEVHGLQEQSFCPRKGQALIWAANLLHGGAPQKDRDRTRHSQVTHYYFEHCSYYMPHHSDPMYGIVAFKEITDIRTGQFAPNMYHRAPLNEEFVRFSVPSHEFYDQMDRRPDLSVPADFDPDEYLQANPDVAQANLDPIYHFKRYGRREGRPLRRDP